MDKFLRKIITLLFVSILLVSEGESVAAALHFTDDDRVVKVGIYEMEGFSYYDEYGELKGYCIDYLKRLSTLTGWTYEYVQLDDFNDGLDKLDQKEIDLLAPVMYTPKRQEKYAFTEQRFGTEYTALLTGSSRTDLYYEDFENYDDLTVGVLNDYPLTDYFKSFCEIYGISPTLVYFDTIEENKNALEAGTVDAIVDSILDVEENQKLLARFAPQPFYFITWKGNTEFLGLMNRAMMQMQNTYPTFLDDLIRKYYPIYDVQFYSREEAEFVKEIGSLRVAYVADRKPLSFTNAEGELDGITRPILDRIAELAGLKFEYVELPKGQISYELLQEMGIDLVSGVEYNSTNMNAKGMLLSTPYLSSRKMIVSKGDFVYDPELPYTMAIAEGSQTLRTVLEAIYPNLTIKNYVTNAECFDALADGEVDMLIQNQFVVEGILSKPSYSEFIVAPMEGLADELSLSTIIGIDGGYGMNEHESIHLIGIINKAISQFGDDELDGMIVRETLQNQYEFDFADFVYSYRWIIVVGVLAFIFMTLFFISLSIIQKNRKKREIEEHRLQELQQKRYKTIIDCSEDLIYEISLMGESNFGSEKIKEKFGWEIPSHVDHLDFPKTMEILHIHPDDEALFRQTLLTKGEGSSDELLVRIADVEGNFIWCKLFRTLLMDDIGNVVSILGKIEDVDTEVRERQALEASTRTDGLTGLLNKQTFKSEVKEYLANNSAKGVGFIFMDMDHFKEINDKMGHRTGDIVIKENAKKIQLLFANFDLASRFGGDEFCVFVKDIPRETLEDRLAFAVEKMREDYPYEGGVIHLSASIGAAYCTRDVIEYRELLEVADDALYKVKGLGRDGHLIVDIE